MGIKDQKRLAREAGVPKNMKWGKSDVALPYPEVASEDATVDLVLSGRSIARYGDGELSLALGGSCVSQKPDNKLRSELVEILARPGDCLVGIPNVFGGTPKVRSWLNYCSSRHAQLYKQTNYVSSFITRPDSAPWIDRADYWNKIRSLWVNREVTYVLGGLRSLRPDDMRKDGATVHEVWGTRTNSYAKIDEIIEQIGAPSHPVLLCLGPAATVIAWRLAKRGIWGIDLGHLGMFMRHGGSYRHHLDDLASPAYREQLELLHADRAWGKAGDAHIRFFLDYYYELECTTMLDYGCGQERLRAVLATFDPPVRVQCYDPGRPDRRGMPKPVDFVVCTDVLEHIEPDLLDNVLDHIFTLAGKGAYLNISCRPAREHLPDGRNAHISLYPVEWWLEKIGKWAGWKIERHEVKMEAVKIWLRKI